MATDQDPLSVRITSRPFAVVISKTADEAPPPFGHFDRLIGVSDFGPDTAVAAGYVEKLETPAGEVPQGAESHRKPEPPNAFIIWPELFSSTESCLEGGSR